MTAAPELGAFHFVEQTPHPPEVDALEGLNAFTYFDFPPDPPLHIPTEGERLIDGFAMIHASEEDD